MVEELPTGTADCLIHGWRLSRRIFAKPEHLHAVLKRFGPGRRRSTLRKIVQELDTIAREYRVALKKRDPKFEEMNPVLEQFENSLLRTKKQWLEEMKPLHPAFITQRVKMIQRADHKQHAAAAMVSIDLELVANTLLKIIKKLRVPKLYAAALPQPRGKSVERAYLWEPLLRLMKKYQAVPGQHGSLIGAVRSLHLAVGIEPPSEGAIKKMRHDLRNRHGSKLRGYAPTHKNRKA
jgi:hypothetical protein